MNSILHQWKWDFRHIRLLWLGWIGLLGLGVIGSHFTRFPDGPMQVASNLLNILQIIATYLFGMLLVARVMYTTPFTGTGAFWKTRPMRRRDLFLAKTLFILALFWLPVMVARTANLLDVSPGASFVRWSLAYHGLLLFAMYFLAAVWASLCERFSSFMVCVASTGAWAAISAMVIGRISRELPGLPVNLTSNNDPLAVTLSTSLSTILLLAAVSVVAWILAAGRGDRARAIGVLAVGVALAVSGNWLWQVQFYRSDSNQQIVETKITVLGKHEQPAPGQRLLWQQIAVEVPPRQFVRTERSTIGFEENDGPRSNMTSFSGGSPLSEQVEQLAIADWYPEGTILYRHRSGNATDSNLPGHYEGLTGTFSGTLDLSVWEWRRVSSLPFQHGAQGTFTTGGLIRIEPSRRNPNDNTAITLMGHMPGRRFTGIDGYTDSIYVLYDESRGTAEIGEGGSFSSSSMGGVFALDSFRSSLVFPKTSSHYRRSQSLPAGLRLDVFEPFQIGKTESITFREENWIAYSDRRFEIPQETEPSLPPIAVAELPEDPTATQIDAYLDSVLFSLPKDLHSNRTRNDAKAQLEAIGPAHLDRLLARLPVGEYANEVVYLTIRRLVSQESLPALLEALPRDPQLTQILLEMGWQREAAPITTELLRKRIPLGWATTRSAVSIVAELQDPATYDDLQWHFVHGYPQHREMIATLSHCPGFPLEESIRAAWQQFRFSRDDPARGRLGGYAARFGDKEALRAAFIYYTVQQKPENLALLEAAVEHPGGDDLPAWLHANFAALEFDPQKKRWALPQ